MNPRKTFRVAIRKFDPFETAIRQTWAAFQEKHPNDLELEAVQLDLDPLYEQIFEQQGLKNGDWDVAFIVTDWLATAHAHHSLLDLAPMIAANPPDDYPHGWSPSLLRMQQFDGQVLGLPYHDGPECLVYRTDLFDDPAEQAAYQARYGVPLHLPQTWDEFHRIARFFNRPEQNLYGTVFAAYPDGHNTVYDFCLQLWTRGGELFDLKGRMQLATPEAIQALSFYRAILNDPTAMHPKAREFDSVQSGMAFAEGEVALMINWFGFAGMSETIAESKVKGKVSIAEIPHGESGPSVSLNVYWVLGIGAGSPHAEIAYRFLRQCAGALPDKRLTLEGGIGCRKSTWQDSEVNRVIPFYHKLEALHTHARELPRLPNWADLAEIIDELVMETITTTRPIEQIAQEIQAKVPSA